MYSQTGTYVLTYIGKGFSTEVLLIVLKLNRKLTYCDCFYGAIYKKGTKMPSTLNPYISFKANAREAMEFYKNVFGGKLSISTFGEYNASQDPAEADKIMHSTLEADNGIIFMASDTPNGMEYQPGATIRMSLSGDNQDELSGYWNKLSDGAQIDKPLEKAPWGDSFGMLTDKFGIEWMVNISPEKAG